MASVADLATDVAQEDLPHNQTTPDQDPDLETVTQPEADPEAEQGVDPDVEQQPPMHNPNPPLLHPQINQKSDIIKIANATNGQNLSIQDAEGQLYQPHTIRHSPIQPRN